MAEIEKTFDLPHNESLESRIQHWERALSDAIHATYVAQEQLKELYPQRFETRIVEIGHTAFTERTAQEENAA